MRLYELVLVLRTSLSEADRKKLVDQVKKALGDIKVTKEEEWGQKPLAYAIKKEIAVRNFPVLRDIGFAILPFKLLV